MSNQEAPQRIQTWINEFGDRVIVEWGEEDESCDECIYYVVKDLYDQAVKERDKIFQSSGIKMMMLASPSIGEVVDDLKKQLADTRKERDEARNKALEEAAQVCDERKQDVLEFADGDHRSHFNTMAQEAHECAATIRDLKSG